jgi:hypothetical protein
MVSNEEAFYYRRCCRVWKLVYGVPLASCGLCGAKHFEPSTKAEHEAQPPLIVPVDDFSPLDLLEP